MNCLRPLCFLLIFTSCLTQRDRPLPPTLLAMVNGVSIKENELRYRIQLGVGVLGEEYTRDEKRFQNIKQETLASMIEELVIIEWGKLNDIELTPEERALGISQLKQGYTNQDFEKFLEEKNVPYSEWSEIAYKTLNVQKILNETLYAKIVITEAEMQQYYQSHQKDFKIKERVQARQIVTDTLEKAEDIRQKLLGGENFAKLAVLHSLSPDRARGGDLGYFERGTHPPEFDKICFLIEPNKISEIIKSDYGYHIFKVLDRKPAGYKSFAELQTLIYHHLFKEKRQVHFSSWFKPIKEKAQIFLNQSALDKLEFE